MEGLLSLAVKAIFVENLALSASGNLVESIEIRDAIAAHGG